MKKIQLHKETNEIQRVITLRTNRNKRHRYQEFILEGRIAIDEAFAKGWKVKSLFYNQERELSSWAKNHLHASCCNQIYAISENLMEKISDQSEPSELIGIGKAQRHSFTTYEPTLGDVVIVLDEPKSPGNLGMIIRSACAFGARAVVISGHGADEYDPKCIRASVGTFFSLPIYRIDGVNPFSAQLTILKQHQKIRVLASGDQGSMSLQETSFDGDPLFLVLGNETSGISRGYQQIADQFVRIDLGGEFTSLNIAAAGSIFLYEIFRSRRRLS